MVTVFPDIWLDFEIVVQHGLPKVSISSVDIVIEKKKITQYLKVTQTLQSQDSFKVKCRDQVALIRAIFSDNCLVLKIVVLEIRVYLKVLSKSMYIVVKKK